MATRPIRIAGTREIQHLIGSMSRQDAYIVINAPDFPQPVSVLKQGRVWLVDDVERWLAERDAAS